MERFEIDDVSKDGWEILGVSGDLDVYTAPRLRERLIEKIEGGKNRIAIDLCDVRFLDSTGLAVMVGTLKRARQSNGDLVLLGANDQIIRILNMTDLIKVLPVYRDYQELAAANQTE
ncbi:MAG: STAS domain-containing protein [Actinomycetota bacterium]|nr:STAS domain-containing protein [Actinomycetota bacterium]